MFGVTFDPKTPIFDIFGDFAGDGPISWSHPDPIQKSERVKIQGHIFFQKVDLLPERIWEVKLLPKNTLVKKELNYF